MKHDSDYGYGKGFALLNSSKLWVPTYYYRQLLSESMERLDEYYFNLLDKYKINEKITSRLS